MQATKPLKTDQSYYCSISSLISVHSSGFTTSSQSPMDAYVLKMLCNTFPFPSSFSQGAHYISRGHN
uniref:Pco092707 n=1 Tax=Arundo donax TaxID=35708 RepID=A0A0A9EXT2_ARUDO